MTTLLQIVTPIVNAYVLKVSVLINKVHNKLKQQLWSMRELNRRK